MQYFFYIFTVNDLIGVINFSTSTIVSSDLEHDDAILFLHHFRFVFAISEILGPEGTPYEKGTFKLDIQIPERLEFFFMYIYASVMLFSFIELHFPCFRPNYCRNMFF